MIKERQHDSIDLRRVRSYSLRDEAVWRYANDVPSRYGRRFDRCQKPLSRTEWRWLQTAAQSHPNEDVRLEAGLLLDWNGR